MFLIGLQSVGQGFVGLTPRLTSALTLCFVTGLVYTRLSVGVQSRLSQTPPSGAFPAPCRALVLPEHTSSFPKVLMKRTSEARFIWAEASANETDELALRRRDALGAGEAD